MAGSYVVKKERSPVLEQIAIVALLIMVICLGLLSVYKYLVKEATVTPEEMERTALINYVNAHPDDDKARQGLAFAYQKAGELAKARQQYNEVLKKNPEELGALYNLGVIAKEEKHYEEAARLFKQVIGLQETHLLATLGLGEVYIAQAKYDDALTILDKAIARQGHLVNLRLLKAEALEKKGARDQATEEYRQVLKYVPDHAEAKAALARLQ